VPGAYAPGEVHVLADRDRVRAGVGGARRRARVDVDADAGELGAEQLREPPAQRARQDLLVASAEVRLAYEALGERVGLALVGVARLADARPRRLHQVRDLVRDQEPPLGRARIVRAGAEEQVVAGRERARADRARRRVGRGVVVDAHVREIRAERSLQLGAHRGVERLAGAARRARRERGVDDLLAGRGLARDRGRREARRARAPARRDGGAAARVEERERIARRQVARLEVRDVDLGIAPVEGVARLQVRHDGHRAIG
jgi:hypothetical protein